jgi:hypothetical protein
MTRVVACLCRRAHDGSPLAGSRVLSLDAKGAALPLRSAPALRTPLASKR